MAETSDIASAARTFQGLISLMRPVNSVVSFLAILSVGVMASGEIHTDTTMLLAAFAGMLIGAAGNIINDVFDVNIDRVNKPNRAIASGTISRKAGAVWAAVCGLTGIALSIPLGTAASSIAVGSVLLLYVYSARLKRVPLLGNVVVGGVTGMAFIYGGFAAEAPLVGIVPAAFAFLMNVGREILKDIEDMPGDTASGHRTFPILFGERPARLLASVVLIAVIAASLHPWTFRQYSNLYLLLVVAVDIVTLTSLAVVWRRFDQHTVKHASALLKWGMLAGILAFTAGSIR